MSSSGARFAIFMAVILAALCVPGMAYVFNGPSSCPECGTGDSPSYCPDCGVSEYPSICNCPIDIWNKTYPVSCSCPFYPLNESWPMVCNCPFYGNNTTSCGCICPYDTSSNLNAGSMMANFTANITYGLAPLTVQFTDLSTGSPNTWLWEFGDGTTSSEKNPVHTYTQPGYYTVQLTVSLNYQSAGIQISQSRSTGKYNYIFVPGYQTGYQASAAPEPAAPEISSIDRLLENPRANSILSRLDASRTPSLYLTANTGLSGKIDEILSGKRKDMVSVQSIFKTGEDLGDTGRIKFTEGRITAFLQQNSRL